MNEDLLFYIEMLAASVSLLGVWLTSRKKLHGWTLGFIGSVMYTAIFFVSGLYAESTLQIFYAFMGVYGWLKWKNETTESQTAVKRIPLKTILSSVLITAALSFVAGAFLDRFSDSIVPYLDASLAAAGLVITLLMAKRFVENWLAWIVVDLVSAALYFDRELHITAVVYLFFTAMAIYGFFHWKRELRTS
jgi:nicotinamide mononucleotide transporter